jgi:hypothetical protein
MRGVCLFSRGEYVYHLFVFLDVLLRLVYSAWWAVAVGTCRLISLDICCRGATKRDRTELSEGESYLVS